MVYIKNDPRTNTKEIQAKIVYYGPGMCGKTTNLKKIHELMNHQMRSDLVSIETETDRTVYFDFLPLSLGKIAGFDFTVRAFTVPGQPYYGETRKIVLQGADGIVFVADSQRYMLDQNKDSMLDLRRNLRLNGLDLDTIPMVMQYNKRDLPDLMDIADLDAALNPRRHPSFVSVARKGEGVIDTLTTITRLVFKHVRDGGLSGAAHAAPPARPKTPFATLPLEVSKPSKPSRPAPGPNHKLQAAVDAVAAGAQRGEAPMPARDALGAQEFQNLAVLHHRLVERVARLESEVSRLAAEQQDLKRVVAKRMS